MRSIVRRLSLAAAVALLAAAAPAFADGAAKAHVAVVRFANSTGSASYDAACKAVTDTLTLALGQLGRYVVQGEEGLTSGSGDDGLRAMAADEQLDFIMYGSIRKTDSGSISCSLSVFDRAKGRTSLSKTGKATGVLDIFDATDALVVSVLEGMTGSHIGFGCVALRRGGEKGCYSVLLDGAPAGSDIGQMDKVLAGRHTVEIVQKRMLGTRKIARAAVDVGEGSSVDFKFSVPYLMDDEKAKLDGLEAAIKAGWDEDARAGEVEAATAELGSLLADVSYSPRLSTYENEAKQLGAEWLLRKNRREIEAAAWQPGPDLLASAARACGDPSGYPDPDRIKSEFEQNARLLRTLLELKAGSALGTGDLEGGAKCFEDALTLSARYLGSERLEEYAYAVSTLAQSRGRVGAGAGSGDLNAVFGPWIAAGKRFADARDQVAAGTSRLIVASDVSKLIRVEGADYAEPPLGAPAVPEARTLNVQVAGSDKPIALAAAGKILFISDGYAAFGKEKAPVAAQEAQAAPEPVFGAVTIGMGSLTISVASEGILQMGANAAKIAAGGLLPVTNVAPGDYSLTMSYPDGKSETKRATVAAGQTSAVAFSYGQMLKEYKLGETGPAGGIVFYDKGNYANGWRYLEAAPSDASASIMWLYPVAHQIQTGDGAGTGKQNTTTLSNYDGPAARLCKKLKTGGASDWFLPSRMELDLMYQNLKMEGLGGFSKGLYWSSSQYGDIYYGVGGGWCEDFSNGKMSYKGIAGVCRVRAIRSF